MPPQTNRRINPFSFFKERIRGDEARGRLADIQRRRILAARKERQPTPAQNAQAQQAAAVSPTVTPPQRQQPATPVQPQPVQQQIAPLQAVPLTPPAQRVQPAQPLVSPQVQQLRRRVTQLAAPTEREGQLRQQIGAILSGQELGAARIADQPIATPFIRGQQAALQRQATAQVTPFQRQLELEQQQRAGQLAGAELGLEFAQQDIEAQRDLREEVEGLAAQAIESGANQEQVNQLLTARNRGEALRTFAGLGLTPGEAVDATGDVKQFLDAQRLGLIPADMDIFQFRKQLSDAGRAPVSERTGLTPIQLFDRELKLAKDFERFAGEAREAGRQIRRITGSFDTALAQQEAGESLNAASQGVLVSFQKLLDPTSVVRESEYARSPQGLALLERIEGKFTQIQQGGAGLTAEALREFVQLGQTFLEGYRQDLLNFARRTQNQANSIGANLENVLTPDVLSLLEGDTRTPEEVAVTEFNSLQSSIDQLSPEQRSQLEAEGLL